MTPAQLALWLALAAPAPDAYFVPGVAMSYQSTLDYWSDVALVPHWLASRVAGAESDFYPAARSTKWVRVTKKDRKRWDVEPGQLWRRQVLAEGLMQISVEHRAEHVRNAGMRINGWLDDPNVYQWDDAAKSIRVGVLLLGRLIARYHGDLRLAVAAYNCGPGRLESARALPSDTVEYLRRIFG